MSDFSIDDDLIVDYLAECREHLANIESDLLSIEQGGPDIDEQVVNRVFRAAHSIKGGAGFFDLVQIKELAHRTENVLDLVRGRELVATPELVSVLLLSFDKLRALVSDYRESNSADISEFTDALTRIVEENRSGGEKKEPAGPVSVTCRATGKAFQVSAFDLEQAHRGGKRIHVLEYDLIHDVQRREKTPLDVLKDLVACGGTLAAEFDLESAGTLEDAPTNQLLFDVLFASLLDASSINRVFNVPPGRIHDIEEEHEAVAAEPEPEILAAAEPAVVADPQAIIPGAPTHLSAVTPAAHAPESTIRLNVALLDSLMMLAGELVLGRNELDEAVRNGNMQGIRSGAHRVSLVTSELQEAVALTRMQPVSSQFSKFPRLVRDLSSQLGKDVQLIIEGGDVELDKTILEGLSDPLTHMIRNAVDHGIETSAERVAAGKPVRGTITLCARHQAGQVLIEIADDGKGLSVEKIAAAAVAKGTCTQEQIDSMSEAERYALIFLPGVTTADRLTSVSGRGVGMDVVKTNLDRLGGKIEIESKTGGGSTFRIKLPLTLAIIPSLLISEAGQRFALPQVNVEELVRIPQDQIADRIKRTGDAELIVLRDRLIPLLRLADVLGICANRQKSTALNVVLVNTGSFEYGVVVEQLHDTVEIVVKPMGRHMQGLREYAGATILGNGQVAVILDVTGLAQRAGLGVVEGMANLDTGLRSQHQTEQLTQRQTLLLFENAPGERCALPIERIIRVERIGVEQVETIAGRRTMRLDDSVLPLVTLQDIANLGKLTETQQWVSIVFEHAQRAVGLLAAEPLDMIDTQAVADCWTLRQPGIAGSISLDGKTVLMLELAELADAALHSKGEPEQERAPVASDPRASEQKTPTVLVAEDSDFFRGQIRKLIEAVGYNVMAAEDGQAAWELLNEHPDEISVVTTDMEMPRLDGVGLTKRIRSDPRFGKLPVIALTTLASEEETARGLAIGVNEYHIKLNEDELLAGIRRAVGPGAQPHA